MNTMNGWGDNVGGQPTTPNLPPQKQGCINMAFLREAVEGDIFGMYPPT